MLSKADDDDSALLGHLLTAARKVAADQGLEKGYRVVIMGWRGHSPCIIDTYPCYGWAPYFLAYWLILMNIM